MGKSRGGAWSGRAIRLCPGLRPQPCLRPHPVDCDINRERERGEHRTHRSRDVKDIFWPKRSYFFKKYWSISMFGGDQVSSLHLSEESSKVLAALIFSLTSILMILSTGNNIRGSKITRRDMSSIRHNWDQTFRSYEFAFTPSRFSPHSPDYVRSRCCWQQAISVHEFPNFTPSTKCWAAWHGASFRATLKLTLIFILTKKWHLVKLLSVCGIKMIQFPWSVVFLKGTKSSLERT